MMVDFKRLMQNVHRGPFESTILAIGRRGQSVELGFVTQPFGEMRDLWSIYLGPSVDGVLQAPKFKVGNTMGHFKMAEGC